MHLLLLEYSSCDMNVCIGRARYETNEEIAESIKRGTD
jgi:hypothetical protein